MERQIPNLKHMLLLPLLGVNRDKTEDIYLRTIESFERKVEKSFIKVLQEIDIKGSVKTDPYSLPYNEELVFSLSGESYMNGAYEYKRVFKRILKELLNMDPHKIRFYFYINPITNIPSLNKEIGNLRSSWGKVEYRFRYHLPNHE